MWIWRHCHRYGDIKKMGATKGKLLKYATSGDVAGDNKSVVGYSSILFV